MRWRRAALPLHGHSAVRMRQPTHNTRSTRHISTARRTSPGRLKAEVEKNPELKKALKDLKEDKTLNEAAAAVREARDKVCAPPSARARQLRCRLPSPLSRAALPNPGVSTLPCPL